MKRFDKGYIYSGLISDLFTSFVIVFAILNEFIIGEEAKAEDLAWAVPLFAISFAVVYICFVIYRILYYRSSGYELTENEIKCNRGVLFRKRSVLDYKKMHAINKKQTLFHRLFGIAILTVDSGSTNTSHQAEITIIEKSKTVDALMRELNALKESGARPSDGPDEAVLISDDDTLYRFTSKKKMIYTIINIASTALFTAVTGMLAIIVIGVCKLMLSLDSLGTWGEYFLFAILITLGAMLLLSFFSFVGCMIHSFVGYHKFTVAKCGNDIQISFGLLERHTNTFSYDRIKAVKISQTLFQRIMGFASIRLEVIGYTNDGGSENNTEIGVLVPFCKYNEVGEILERVLPDYIPDEKQTRSVSYFSYVSWFALILGIVIAAVLLPTVAAMLILNAPSSAIVAVVLAVTGAGIAVFGVKALHAAFSYKTNGIAVRNGKITAYYGGFTKNVTVFMAKNLIAAESVTTPLRQKAGIASLVMHLKTNSMTNEIKVHIQDEKLTKELEGLLRL